MLTIKIPKRERKLDENKIVGVRLGVNISATCALYDPEDLDNKYDFIFWRSEKWLSCKTIDYSSVSENTKKSFKSNSGQNGHRRKKRCSL